MTRTGSIISKKKKKKKLRERERTTRYSKMTHRLSYASEIMAAIKTQAGIGLRGANRKCGTRIVGFISGFIRSLCDTVFPAVSLALLVNYTRNASLCI